MYKTDFHVIELQSTIYTRDIKNNRDNIGYAEHILNTRHLYGTIQDTMEIIKAVKKGPIMDTIEKYHIYKANQNGIQFNDTHTNNKNPLFDTLYRYQQAEYQRKHSYSSHKQPDTNTR
jgi:hypothetical protein